MSPNGITIRNASANDLDAIATLYNAIWCNWLREVGAMDDWRLCGRLNVAVQLERSPIALVAEQDGRVVATCLAGAYDEGCPRKNGAWRATYAALLAQGKERARTADEDLEGSLFGDSREIATAERFAAKQDDEALGQINLIVVSPDCQGQGLGRMLIGTARTHLREAGCRRFFLMTDNHSDWQFYEHLGMSRLAEDHSQDTGDGFVVYMYGGEC